MAALCASVEEQGIVPGGEHVARHRLGDIPIDIMATGWGGAGKNRWYAEAFGTRVFHPDIGLHVVAPPWFLATKMVAFADRGAHDPLVSHDLEDVLRLLSASDQLQEWLRGPSTQEVHRYLVYELRALARSPSGLEIVQAHHEAHASAQEQAERLWQVLRDL